MRRVRDWVKENRYQIIGVSWVVFMAVTLGLLRLNPYLSGSQKLVQECMIAQGLTFDVLIATAAVEVGDAKVERENTRRLWCLIRTIHYTNG